MVLEEAKVVITCEGPVATSVSCGGSNVTRCALSNNTPTENCLCSVAYFVVPF